MFVDVPNNDKELINTIERYVFFLTNSPIFQITFENIIVSVKNCDASENAPVIVYVSKMFVVDKEALPKDRVQPVVRKPYQRRKVLNTSNDDGDDDVEDKKNNGKEQKTSDKKEEEETDEDKGFF